MIIIHGAKKNFFTMTIQGINTLIFKILINILLDIKKNSANELTMIVNKKRPIYRGVWLDIFAIAPLNSSSIHSAVELIRRNTESCRHVNMHKKY